MVQDEKENFLKENYLFKQGLVQQEKGDEVETRVATIEFAHLDQLAQDLEIETKVNKSKKKMQKMKSSWRQNADNNTHIDNIIRSPLRLLTPTKWRMRSRKPG